MRLGRGKPTQCGDEAVGDEGEEDARGAREAEGSTDPPNKVVEERHGVRERLCKPAAGVLDHMSQGAVYICTACSVQPPRGRATDHDSQRGRPRRGCRRRTATCNAGVAGRATGG